MHESLMSIELPIPLLLLFGECLSHAFAQDPLSDFVLGSTDSISDALDGRLSYSMTAGKHPTDSRFVDSELLGDFHLCMSVNHDVNIPHVDTLCQPVLGCLCGWTPHRED